MPLLMLILQLLTMAMPLAVNAEQLVRGAKKGAVKKELATATLAGALDLATSAGAMTAGDAAKGKELAPIAVDLVVGILNKANVFKPGGEAA